MFTRLDLLLLEPARQKEFIRHITVHVMFILLVRSWFPSLNFLTDSPYLQLLLVMIHTVSGRNNTYNSV